MTLKIVMTFQFLSFFFSRLACAQSDPGVRSYDRRPFCSQCKTSDHYTRSCPARFSGPLGREDDVIVASLLTTKEEEPEEQRGLVNTLWS